MTAKSTVLILVGFLLSACSPSPTPKRLAQDTAEAMGGTEKIRAIRTISMKGGAGTRFRLGQMPRLTDQEPASQLTNVTGSVIGPSRALDSSQQRSTAS
jgi:hypothetical protein